MKKTIIILSLLLSSSLWATEIHLNNGNNTSCDYEILSSMGQLGYKINTHDRIAVVGFHVNLKDSMSDCLELSEIEMRVDQIYVSHGDSALANKEFILSYLEELESLDLNIEVDQALYQERHDNEASFSFDDIENSKPVLDRLSEIRKEKRLSRLQEGFSTIKEKAKGFINTLFE